MATISVSGGGLIGALIHDVESVVGSLLHDVGALLNDVGGLLGDPSADFSFGGFTESVSGAGASGIVTTPTIHGVGGLLEGLGGALGGGLAFADHTVISVLPKI